MKDTPVWVSSGQEIPKVNAHQQVTVDMGFAFNPQGSDSGLDSILAGSTACVSRKAWGLRAGTIR